MIDMKTTFTVLNNKVRFVGPKTSGCRKLLLPGNCPCKLVKSNKFVTKCLVIAHLSMAGNKCVHNFSHFSGTVIHAAISHGVICSVRIFSPINYFLTG